jgi:hypothetical protein
MRETDDRTGGPTKLVQIETDEMLAISDADVGGPRLYKSETKVKTEHGEGVVITWYAEAKELKAWRASQA